MMNNLLSKLAIFCIRVYQKRFSQILGRRLKCRFYPSCSEYAALSIKKYGAIKGIAKAYHRLIKCRPDNFDSCIDLP